MKNQVLLIPHISLLKFPESESNSWEAWITEANEKSAKEAEMLKNCGYEIVKYETARDMAILVCTLPNLFMAKDSNQKR